MFIFEFQLFRLIRKECQQEGFYYENSPEKINKQTGDEWGFVSVLRPNQPVCLIGLEFHHQASDSFT